MALKTFVKVGGITNLSDARYCAGMGVDLLGFRVVEAQPYYINPKQFQEISGWVTGPQIVAELYGIKSIQELKFILENYRPDFLELGTKELSILSEEILLPFILSLEHNETLGNLTKIPFYVVVKQGSENVKQISMQYSTLIEVTDYKQVEKLLEQFQPKGIALHGSAEIKPGLKDYQELADVLELLDTDN